MKSLSCWFRFSVVVASLAAAAGCFEINVPDTLIATGGAFVVSGTAEVIDVDGPCLVWRGDNGVIYHLFQQVNLENEIFDEVTEPGVTSRLVLAERTDLDVNCRVGPTVEVRDVLEVIE